MSDFADGRASEWRLLSRAALGGCLPYEGIDWWLQSHRQLYGSRDQHDICCVHRLACDRHIMRCLAGGCLGWGWRCLSLCVSGGFAGAPRSRLLIVASLMLLGPTRAHASSRVRRRGAKGTSARPRSAGKAREASPRCDWTTKSSAAPACERTRHKCLLART